MENIELWNKNCGKEYNLVKMIYFHCSQDILEKRLEGRSGKTGRSDDSKEVVAKRMATYKRRQLQWCSIMTPGNYVFIYLKRHPH